MPGACRESKPAVATVAGASLPLHSVGMADGGTWVLDENGYAGAFVSVKAPGPVVVTVRASGHADQGAPHLGIAVLGAVSGFDVGPEPKDYAYSTVLPAGTHFVRLEQSGAPPDAHRELTLESVKVEGAALLGEATDALALAAADSYVAFGRRGHATVRVPGAMAGATARVKLVRHAFNFGVNMPFADNRLIPAELEPNGPAERYQKFVLERFNTVVLSNAGKWVYQEEKKDKLTLAHVDRFFEFAEKHGLRARMHTMLWDTTQQPAWVGSEDAKTPGLMTRALHGDAKATAELDRQIDERIAYYVKERAKRYLELDVINESVHRSRYLELYGAAGIADIFKRTARAVKDGAASTRLFLNEYNVLQWSSDPLSGAPDPYANWYRRHAERVIAAGGPVDGLGVQYYPDGREAREIGSNAHSPLRIFAALQNLATTGRRLSLTELTVKSQNATPERAARIVEDTLRLVLGTPEADTFMIWAVWAGASGDPPAPASVLLDAGFAPTEPGKRFDALMKSYDTDLEVPVQAGGTLAFDGFYGDYEVLVGGRTRRLAFTRGRQDLALTD